MPELPRVLAEGGPTGIVRRSELDAIRPDRSTRHLGISAAPLLDAGHAFVGRVIHFQDLTELRRMELAVARAERLASVGRLAAAIAHEIRNPLASISGSIEILRDAPGADPDSRVLMEIAVREVDRLNALITNLLEYARPRTEERRRVDLGEEVSELVRAFEHERRDGRRPIRVVLVAAPGVVVEAAGSQIRQVVWNLLRNAAEAMPPGGGTIGITVAAGPATRGSAGGASPTEATLAVRDTGTGIPAADLDHIFEPFFSTKSGGTGLGLATVARIVDDHRGTIEVTSEVGSGTTVTVHLPAAASGSSSHLSRDAA
jgi:two-component system sensor histidine kinase PilS (NtrC family)